MRCIQARTGTYYYRQRLPKEVAGLLGQGEFIRSLRTDDRDVAHQRSVVVRMALHRALALLQDIQMTDPATARQLFRRWFGRQLEKDFRQRQSSSGVRPVESYPTYSMQKIQWAADKALGRSKLESEARFIAGRLVDNENLTGDQSELVTLECPPKSGPSVGI